MGRKMNYWFTSDYHLGHENIIKYTGRPFKSLYHMDESIIKTHNERVKKGDTVFFLGDFCFRNSEGGKKGEGALEKSEHYLNQLNGNFVFIRGNHDNNNSTRTVIESIMIHIGGKDIYMCHKPDDYEPGFLNFVGHVHELWKFKVMKDGTHLINVGVDIWKRPIGINEILKEYGKWIKGEIIVKEKKESEERIKRKFN